ncbi:MAG: DNA-directed RNA polymerase subunit beta, partial [Synergistaceae bacterium]|nr:DNA-directed RNA polymerase subunit beta [Synergistaceae bacterium]
MSKKRQRFTFGRAHDLIEIPDMIEVQRASYRWFYQDDVAPDSRVSQGLQELLTEVFPIESYDGQFSLSFVRYYVDSPSLSEEEARRRDMTWTRPIRATIRLTNTKLQEIKEEEIFLGDFPVMTERGTFVINGTERVVINQLARSAGVYFTKEDSVPGQESCAAKIIPDRGAWLDFALAAGEIVSVNIDNRKKLPVSLLLKAFGAKDNDGILQLFGVKSTFMEFDDNMRGMLSAEEVYDVEGNVIVARNRPITRDILEKLMQLDPTGRGGIEVQGVDPSLALTL